jgi:hypothetical protein
MKGKEEERQVPNQEASSPCVIPSALLVLHGAKGTLPSLKLKALVQIAKAQLFYNPNLIPGLGHTELIPAGQLKTLTH